MKFGRLARTGAGVATLLLFASAAPSHAVGGSITAGAALPFQGVSYKRWQAAQCNASDSTFQAANGVDGRLFDVSGFVSRGSANVSWSATASGVPAAAVSPGSSLSFQTFRTDCTPTGTALLHGNGPVAVPAGTKWMFVEAVQIADVTVNLT